LRGMVARSCVVLPFIAAVHSYHAPFAPVAPSYLRHSSPVVQLPETKERLLGLARAKKTHALHHTGAETHALRHKGAADQAGLDTAQADEPAGSRIEGAMLMFCVAILWGTNFPAVKATIEAGLPASVAAASRFSIASLALLPLLRKARELPRELIVGGLECGCWIALGYVAQALALGDLQAGAVAFLASLQVVFVPLVLTALGGEFTPRLALASFMCVAGVALLELGGLSGQAVAGNADGAGDMAASLIALLQPVGFGTSYIRIEALMKKYPERGLQISALQLISNAMVAIAWCGFDVVSSAGQLNLAPLSEPAVLGGLLYTGLVSTALTVLLQTRALGMLSATDSSVIIATEPLWAAGLAGMLLGEVLDGGAQLGGMLIVAGCLSNALLPTYLGLPHKEPAAREECFVSQDQELSSGSATAPQSH